jgi:hypothetical protein
MTKAKPLPALELLQEYLHYDPETGFAYWKKSPARNTKPWTMAGTKKKDYWIIRFGNKDYQAHRIFWFLYYRQDPIDSQIDHKDGDKFNNKICNLREVTNAQNQMNLQKARANNKTGVLGVCWDKKAQRYKAYITVEKKKRHIGNFLTLEEAAVARQHAVAIHFGEFAPQSK